MRSNSRVLLWSIAAVVTAVVLYSSALMGTGPAPRSEDARRDATDEHPAPVLERVEAPPEVVTAGAPGPDAGHAAFEELPPVEPQLPSSVDVLPPTDPEAWKPNAPPLQRGTDLVFSNSDNDGKKKKESEAPKPASSPPPEQAVPASADVLPPTRYDTPETAPKAEPGRDTGLRFSTKPAEDDKP